MAFTKFKLLSYEAVSGTASADTLLPETLKDVNSLLLLTAANGSLTPEEKSGVKVLSGEQAGVVKVFVLIPCADVQRVNNALRQIWNPGLQSTKKVDVFMDVQLGE